MEWQEHPRRTEDLCMHLGRVYGNNVENKIEDYVDWLSGSRKITFDEYKELKNVLK